MKRLFLGIFGGICIGFFLHMAFETLSKPRSISILDNIRPEDRLDETTESLVSIIRQAHELGDDKIILEALSPYITKLAAESKAAYRMNKLLELQNKTNR